MSDASDRARRWLEGGHRTWRWNDGTYANKNRYQALETGDDGLSYFSFDGARGGLGPRLQQSFAAYRERGPEVLLPDDVARELERWLAERGL